MNSREVDIAAPSRLWPSALAPLADLGLLGRHQLAAAVATAADFMAMIVLVQIAALSPPLATILSAALGGAINFALARRWAFQARHSGPPRSQALRYAAVSIGGALLNAGALAAILAVVAIAYPLARAVASVVVSLLYTYPLHTLFVFRVAGRPGVGRRQP